jgi:4-amino-4-deoxy-L-arabinose transferase-like glycosyltransferase
MTPIGTRHLGTCAAAVAVTLVAMLVCLRSSAGEVVDRASPLISQASSLAAGGTDASGRLHPLFVHAGGESWLQPIPVYVLTTLMRAGIEDAMAARLMAGLFGAVSAWLLYLLGARLFERPATAIVAAAFFVFSPAYFTLGSAGNAAMAALPPVLIWFVCVAGCVQRCRPWCIALAAAALGTAVYTQPAGVLAVPSSLLVGLMVLKRRLHWRHHLAVALGMASVLAPLVVWYWQHPETWPDTLGRWAVHLAHIRDPWHGVTAFAHWEVAGRRAGEYWHYFSPVYLFLSGSVFLGVAGLLLPLGLFCRTRTRMAEARSLLRMAFLAAPLAAVLLDEPRSLELAAGLVPIGALLAAGGLDFLCVKVAEMYRPALAFLPRTPA